MKWPRLLFAAMAALLLLFVVLPIALLAARATAEGPSVFGQVLSSAASRSALVNSLLVGAGVALVALAAGAPLGAALARLPVSGSRALSALLVLPLAVPSYVWAMAWISLAAPRSGWLNRAAAALGAGGPPFNAYGLPGIIWVEGLALFPLVLLPVRATLEAADPSLEEAARICGGGPLRAFATGSLPLALPAAASGTLLAFLAALSSFGVPYLLGVASERPALVATTRIYQALSLGARADALAALALSVLLLVFAALASVLASRLARAVPQPSGKGKRIGHLDAPHLTRAASVLAWAFTAVAVLLPVGAVILSAFTKRFGEPVAPENLTLQQFAQVLGNHDVRTALAHSALLALGTASLVVLAGCALAFLRRVLPSAASSAALRVSEAAYAVPGSVLALALLFAFSQEVRFVFLDRAALVFAPMGTIFILLIAYSSKYLAFGSRAAGDAVQSVDPALEEAARISGAGPVRAFVHATLPLIRPQLFAAFVLAFLPAATELTMSVLLAGPRTQVLGTVLFELASYADPPSAAVLACVVLALAASAELILRRLGRNA